VYCRENHFLITGNNMMTYLSKYFTSKAIAAYFIVLTICSLLFMDHMLPLLWIVFGMADVLFFFYFSNRISLRWTKYSPVMFRKKLFKTAFIIRIIYVIAIYFFFKKMTGIPFEFEAGDSQGYHVEGAMVADWIMAGNFGKYFTEYRKGVSDMGYPLWLSVIYLFSFKSIIVARIVNALVGAWTCVLIYNIARRNFGEEAARISAVFAMLLPTFIYFCGLHTKETVMVFILVAFIERSDNLVRMRSLKFWNVLLIIFLGVALFFFRTVLAVAAWFSLFSALLFSSSRVIGPGRRAIYATWFIVATLIVFSGRILTEVEGYSNTSGSNQEQKISLISTREGANKLAKYGRTAVFAPVMLMAPFPTLVNVATQQNAMMTNGALFTRNIFVFFVIMALFLLFKQKLLTQHVQVIVMLLSYLVILAASGYALSPRFHMPALPFLVILAGYGVTKVNRQYLKYYLPYLVLIVMIIIFWNWFKLAGRGMV
jgi:hypothetical protein